MRGITIPWIVFYGLLLILLLAIVPTLVTVNSTALGGYDNKADPAYFIQAALPFILFALVITRPWKNTEIA